MRKILAVLILVSFAIGNFAFASDDVVCLAVYPCDEQGNLLEEYADAESPCLDYYIGQCLVAKLQISKYSIQSCEFQKADLEATIDSLNATERKYRKLRKKLQQLRSANRE